MHRNAELIRRLFTALDKHDHATMADCYHAEATFRDIAFELRGRGQIHAMWRMVCAGDIRAAIQTVEASHASGRATLVDTYTFGAQREPFKPGRPVRNEVESRFTFRDGLIVQQHDFCDAPAWAAQALGGLLGVVAGHVRLVRSLTAKRKLDAFIARHRESSPLIDPGDLQ